MAEAAVTKLKYTSNLTDSVFDSLIVVSTDVERLVGPYETLHAPVTAYNQVDKSASSSISVIVSDAACGQRLVYSPTGPLNRDQDDVRRVYEAAEAGIKRALATGSSKPLLCLTKTPEFDNAEICAILGALHALYVPLEIREDCPSKATKASLLGWFGEQYDAALFKAVEGYEAGRIVARDIGGSDPERMAPPRVQQYVESTFASSSVNVEVISDEDTLTKEYPLLAAVNRAARHVNRHQGRVIWLTYEGEGPVDQTVMLVGKGICYDTGGADIKAGGVMAGMHRDKCGAAAVAGFFKTLDTLRPKGLKVVGAMCTVRNSVGSECYVADEIITSRAGVRVRVGNTDAEGRMAMTDVLCHMKEKALDAVNPSIYTWATLTGHVIIAHGSQYSAVMGNGPACMERYPATIIENGCAMSDPCQLSTIMREDYEFAAGKSEYEDVLQCNNEPSSRTPRGHQFPAAFMIMASGLDKHGKDSDKPLKYCHVDVAGSSGPYPGIPTGAPILAFAKTFLVGRY